MAKSASAEAAPAAVSERFERLYIGGEWSAPKDGEIVESIDPSTGRPWAMAAFGGKADTDRAVAAANQALKGPLGRYAGLATC